MEKRERVFQLEKLIKHHKALYYQGRPEISDEDFDVLEEELRKLSPKNKILSTVGELPRSGLKVAHQTKMLSLDKTYEEKELEKWIDGREVLSTFKIDGVSCSLVYQKGILVQAKTRGDGSVGEDITAKVHWMGSTPSIISSRDAFVEIRGELYCLAEDFYRLSHEMEKIGLDKPSSQRNIVAGLVSRKDHLELCRYIKFKGFDCINASVEFKLEEEKYHAMKKYGLETAEYSVHDDFNSLSLAISEAQDFIVNGNYLIDGLVVILNDIRLHEQLGSTAHHPRFKMAFKFKGVAKKTVLQEIVWSVSRNGVLTPVGKVATVELSGAAISRVSLHNYGLVKQYSLKKGDIIEIVRSGEVIPKFLSVVKSSQSPFVIPNRCPACANQLAIDDIRLRCDNPRCSGAIKESILHFVQKIGIDDLNIRRLDEMIKKGLVGEIVDLYRLKKEDFLKLDKTKERLAVKLYDSIQKSKKTNFVTFLSSLGISGGAYNKSAKIVQKGFDSVEKLKAITVDQLKEVDSFADKSAKLFVESLRKKIPLIENLLDAGFEFTAEKKKKTKLTGKNICITGTLSEKRMVIEEFIRKKGGKVVGTISKNTDFFIDQ